MACVISLNTVCPLHYHVLIISLVNSWLAGWTHQYLSRENTIKHLHEWALPMYEAAILVHASNVQS